MFDDMCNIEHGPVVGWDRGMVGKKEVAACAAARVGYAKAASVTVGCEYHLACVVRDDGFLLRG